MDKNETQWENLKDYLISTGQNNTTVTLTTVYEERGSFISEQKKIAEKYGLTVEMLSNKGEISNGRKMFVGECMVTFVNSPGQTKEKLVQLPSYNQYFKNDSIVNDDSSLRPVKSNKRIDKNAKQKELILDR